MWKSGENNCWPIVFDSVKWVMKKTAILINGLSAPIKNDYFLVRWLVELGYEVERIEPMERGSIDEVESEPDLIIGWSMGGLIAPELALKYPKSKLILAATGVKVNPDQRTAKFVFEMVGTEWGMKLLGAGLKLPKNILMDSYEQLNKIPASEVRENYRKQMEENIALFQRIPSEQIKSMIDYLKKTDNSWLLKRLENKTLVVCGKLDRLMPVEEGKRLAGLIKNSQLVVTEGGHYNVISETELPMIKKFLE